MKTNAEKFEKTAKELISFLQESLSQLELDMLGGEDLNDNISVDDSISSSSMDEIVSSSPIDSDENISNPIEVTEPVIVPVEKPPKFRIYWRAWKEGNNTSGQTESNLETAQMARAESMTKLYDLGFDNIEVLAIETISEPQTEISGDFGV